MHLKVNNSEDLMLCIKIRPQINLSYLKNSSSVITVMFIVLLSIVVTFFFLNLICNPDSKIWVREKKSLEINHITRASSL